jgi:hypothetical protein
LQKLVYCTIKDRFSKESAKKQYEKDSSQVLSHITCILTPMSLSLMLENNQSSQKLAKPAQSQLEHASSKPAGSPTNDKSKWESKWAWMRQKATKLQQDQRLVENSNIIII